MRKYNEKCVFPEVNESTVQAPKEKLEDVDVCYKSLLGNGVAMHDMPDKRL